MKRYIVTHVPDKSLYSTCEPCERLTGALRVSGILWSEINGVYKSRNHTDLTMAPKIPKKKNGTPPPIDKLAKPAIGVALALLGYYFFKGINSEVCKYFLCATSDSIDLTFACSHSHSLTYDLLSCTDPSC